MATLSDRLKKVQTEIAVKSIPDIPIQDLEVETINFGKKHRGKTFNQVWMADQGWVQWFISHFHASSDSNHRKFLMFVEKKVSELELWENTILKTNGEPGTSSQQPVQPRPKVNPKAKSKMPPPMDLAAAEAALLEAEEEEEGFDVIDTMEMPTYQSQEALDVAALQTRMLNLENALTEIVQHLRGPQPQ